MTSKTSFLSVRTPSLRGIAALAAAVLVASGTGLAAEAKDIYKRKCVACHGATGAPTPPFAKRGVRDLSDPEWQKSKTDDQIRKAITEGSAGTLMRSFAKELSKDDVAGLVAFIRSLDRAKK